MRPIHTQTINLGTMLRIVGIGLLIVLILVYVLFQARNVLQGPTIVLSGVYDVVQHDRTVTIQGVAQNIVKLTLNGREIHTTEAGDFTQMLVLENGYTIVELSAHDRFGRISSLTREYVYVPQST